MYMCYVCNLLLLLNIIILIALLERESDVLKHIMQPNDLYLKKWAEGYNLR